MEKNQHTTWRKAPFIVSLIVSLYFIQSCQKEDHFGFDNQISPRASLLGESRLYFKQQITDQHLEPMPNNPRHRAGKVPLWDRAEKVQLSVGEGLKVPLQYRERISLLVGPNQEEVPLEELSYLLVYRDQLARYHYEVVTQVPNAEYWTHRHEAGRTFSGIIIVEDWWGRPIKTFKKVSAQQYIVLSNPVLSTKPRAKNSNEPQNLVAAADDCNVVVTMNEHHMYEVELICDSPTGGGGGNSGEGGGNGPGWGNPGWGGWGMPGGLGGGDNGGGGYGGPQPPEYEERPRGGGVGGPVENPPAPEDRESDIDNHVTDPCLRSVVQDLRMASLTRTASDIITALDENVKVRIEIKDSIRTPNGKPANTGKFRYNPNTLEFSAKTVLSQEVILSSTKEYAAAIIIHEIIHSYFNYLNKVPKLGELIEHEEMAQKYIQPMAEFLSQLYGISMQDGVALAWAGLDNAKSYTESEFFDYPGGTMNKQEMNRIFANYVSKYSGTPLCAPSRYE